MKSALSAGLVAGLIFAAPAAAAPVTVNLRIEGPSRTLFEGPVTTDVRPFHFSGGADHMCDGSPPAGTSSVPAVTRGAVLTAAEDGTPFTAHGTWSDQFGSPSFSDIAGENVAYDPGTNRYLVEYLNGKPSMTGSCGEPVAAGDSVLYAYGTGAETLLALSGPATVKPGQPATLTVRDAGGAPVAGATVDGGTSAADGSVVVGPFSDRGVHAEKATKDGAIRSNAVQICVTDGADGACGTTIPGAPKPAAVADRVPPSGGLTGLRDHSVLKTGPRLLRGSFADPSGVRVVKLRLTRRVGNRCWYFSGRSARFRGTRCGHGPYFGIGDRADWSYLLPQRLATGRYVLDAVAIDAAGNRTPLARGTTRVVFQVR